MNQQTQAQKRGDTYGTPSQPVYGRKLIQAQNSKPSGTVKQGRRPMFKPFDQEGRDQEFGPNWKQHFPSEQATQPPQQGDTFAEPSKLEFFERTGELPPEYLREYDGAAEHFARKGELPQAMGSPGALDYINADPEAFEARVNDFKYALAMEATDAKHNPKHLQSAMKAISKQGEHSPLPDARRPWQNDPVTCVDWKSGGVTDIERIANLQFSLRNEVDAHVKVIKERDKARNHADKLAEALANVADDLENNGECFDSDGARIEYINKTLAAYESEVRQ